MQDALLAGEKYKNGLLKLLQQRSEISPAVGDVGETLFSPHLLFIEGIKCPLIDLAWFSLGSAPQCYTWGRLNSRL